MSAEAHTRHSRRGFTLALTLLGGLLATHLPGQESDRVRINGYSSFEFERRLSDQGGADPNGSFDVDLFDLVFNFEPSSRVRVAADVTWEHGPATEDGRGNVALEYGFAEYYVKDWLRLRAGKMFTAFGIYNEIHTAKPAFIPVKEPWATNTNTKMGGAFRFYPRWLAGLAAVGDIRLGDGNLDYALQLTNGEQENTNPFEEDDNTQKSVTARVRYRLTSALGLGLSFYTDRLSELDESGDDTGARSNLTSWGAFVTGSRGGLGAELEYVQGALDPSASASIRQNGLSAMVYYRLKDRYTPYVQYQRSDPDRDQPDDGADRMIYGVNVRIAEVMFLKAEIDSQYSGKANTRYGGVDFHEFKGAIVVGF